MATQNSVSMRDVAALAGVSLGTVSNVLNSPQRVSTETRGRVQAAIDKLGWVPNSSARQLKVGRSNTVGMVVVDLSNPFFGDLIEAAENLLYETNYSVQVSNSAQLTSRERMLLERFEQQRVAGVLFISIDDSLEPCIRLRRRGIPVVLVDHSGAQDFCSVGVDDVAGGLMAGRHLVEQGHRAIVFVGCVDAPIQVKDRLRGLQFAADAVSPPIRVCSIEVEKLSLDAGAEAAARIVSVPPADRPTAVFAANDLLAIGLLQGLVAAGLRVPEDIAIVGYDDIDFAAAATVPLSSVRQPRKEVGRRSAELLLAEMADDSQHHHETVRYTPQLIVRRSSSLAVRP